MPDITITVSTTVNLPIEKVWPLFTSPDHIKNWYHASPDWHAPEAENDLREGGKFRTKMSARDGSMAFDFEGVYTLVETNKKISFELSDKRKVEIDFTAQGNSSTKIVESFEIEDQNSADLQKAGWQAILDNFKRYAETSE